MKNSTLGSRAAVRKARSAQSQPFNQPGVSRQYRGYSCGSRLQQVLLVFISPAFGVAGRIDAPNGLGERFRDIAGPVDVLIQQQRYTTLRADVIGHVTAVNLMARALIKDLNAIHGLFDLHLPNQIVMTGQLEPIGPFQLRSELALANA